MYAQEQGDKPKLPVSTWQIVTNLWPGGGLHCATLTRHFNLRGPGLGTGGGQEMRPGRNIKVVVRIGYLVHKRW